MDLLKAIDSRCSRRKYLPTPIDKDDIEKLNALLEQYNREGCTDMRMVLNNGGAWNGLRNSYGMFSGVANYIGLIYKKNDFQALERMGYYGELWVLNATMLGLGTCWVGGSFKRALCPFDIKDDEQIACTIAFGHVERQLSGKEKLFHRLTHRKTKSVADMMQADADAPEWFIDGVKAVQKAPSAINRQPVVFAYKDGIASASVAKYNEVGIALDFGIAKQHFELGAGGGKWDWGNNGAFRYKSLSSEYKGSTD